jgi:GNAT superfamily N-acetyltransferase
MDRQPLDFTIRETVEADTSSIATLVTELGYPSTVAEMRQRLATIDNDVSCRTFVADLAGMVVGIAGVGIAPCYERNGIYGRLLILAVAEQYRRRGIGRALVDSAEAWSAAQGARLMLVNSGLHRHDAHRFYERAGYASTGLRFVKDIETRAPVSPFNATDD